MHFCIYQHVIIFIYFLSKTAFHCSTSLTSCVQGVRRLLSVSGPYSPVKEQSGNHEIRRSQDYFGNRSRLSDKENFGFNNGPESSLPGLVLWIKSHKSGYTPD